MRHCFPPVQSGGEIEKLRAQLAEQQAQLDQLRAVLEQQKKLIDGIFHASDAQKPKNPGRGSKSNAYGAGGLAGSESDTCCGNE